VEKLEPSCIADGTSKWCYHFGKQYSSSSESYTWSEPVILGTHPREMKKHGHVKTCTQMFMAALFIATLKWNQPKCPLTDE
jgi:hypothetical protein